MADGSGAKTLTGREFPVVGGSGRDPDSRVRSVGATTGITLRTSRILARLRGYAYGTSAVNGGLPSLKYTKRSNAAVFTLVQRDFNVDSQVA